MHVEAYQYVGEMLAEVPIRSAGAFVVEIGSYNVNGSVRPLFADCAQYVGIDVRPGRDVDLVWDGIAPLELPAGTVDIVVSAETLEHAADPQGLISHAATLLRPGGWLILTAASHRRAPHSCDGYDVIPPGEHYQGITPSELSAWLAGWDHVEVQHHPRRGDVYAIARKPIGI